MAVLVSIVSNHKKLVKKCAVTMKHFSNPGTMLVLVPVHDSAPRTSLPLPVDSTCTSEFTRDHSTFNWVYRFLVMGRIFKAARPRFNVISGIEDFINVLNDLKNYR